MKAARQKPHRECQRTSGHCLTGSSRNGRDKLRGRRRLAHRTRGHRTLDLNRDLSFFEL